MQVGETRGGSNEKRRTKNGDPRTKDQARIFPSILQYFIEKIVNVLFSCFLKTGALDNYVIGVGFFNREINFSIKK